MKDSVTETLLIRADAGQQIGIGHVMRCSALAHTFQDLGGAVVFVTSNLGVLRGRLGEQGMMVHELSAKPYTSTDAEETLAVAKRRSARIAVIDGYGFDAEYLRNIRKSGLPTLYIDDPAALPEYPVDFLLNQNLHAAPELYPAVPAEKLLLGPRYALLRREFEQAAVTPRVMPETAKRVLCVFGGTDVARLSEKAVHALRRIPSEDISARIVVADAERAATLRETCRDTRNIEVISAPTSMVEPMQWADIAVSAAGSTSWELCHLGVPSLLIVVADNQVPIARSLADAGAAENLGWAADLTLGRLASSISSLLHDHTRREKYASRGMQLVPGGGAAAVLRAIGACQ